MDLNEIKKLISRTGGKYVIVENDSPKYVFMSFDEFDKATGENDNKLDVPARTNEEKVAAKEVEEAEDYSSLESLESLQEKESKPISILDTEEETIGEVKVEDLPF